MLQHLLKQNLLSIFFTPTGAPLSLPDWTADPYSFGIYSVMTEYEGEHNTQLGP